MPTEKRPLTFHEVLGRVVAFGVGVSALCMLVGVAIWPLEARHVGVTSNSLFETLSGAAQWHAEAWMQLGIDALLGTPLLTLAAAVAYYLRGREWRFGLMGLVVLAVLARFWLGAALGMLVFGIARRQWVFIVGGGAGLIWQGWLLLLTH